ncbi:MAG: AraC family transcriptional regulator [Bacteroidales bacterium]|nr:AraC family transcriptional regulator [Bacteroidales bacterium]
MKPVFEQVLPGPERSFKVIMLDLPALEGPYHYHPEMELTWVVSTSGSRYVGGHLAGYEPDDLVLVAPGVPHTWLSSSEGQPRQAQAIVVQFDRRIGGEAFWQLPAMQPVDRFLASVSTAVVVQDPLKRDVTRLMAQMPGACEPSRLLLLLQILQMLTLAPHLDYLTDDASRYLVQGHDRERFQLVYSYLISNFRRPITLGEVSAVASLSPPALSRFFTRVARKPLMQVVAAMRVNEACSLLRTTSLPVSEVALRSGFGNLSHFNKTFRNVTNCTPFDYRQRFTGP